jgi:hypothetical protein
MKSLIAAFLFVLCLHTKGFTQNFEGYIKFAFTVDLGAANNAKMAEANTKMNTPETKAQLEALKQKMNDPEFKKMMESNPQLKAQMEAMLAMSQGGTQALNSYLPKDATLHFKNGNSLYTMNGGTAAIMGDILYLKDKDLSYHIYRERKAYKIAKKEEQKKSTAIVTKTTETQIILGHTCTKYLVKDGETNLIIWATTDLKTLYDSMKKMTASKERNLYMDQIEGIPLKVESQSKDIHFTMEAIELKEQAQPASDFIIPVGFTEEKTK